jgi:hypothetical protein
MEVFPDVGYPFLEILIEEVLQFARKLNTGWTYIRAQKDCKMRE